MNCDSFFTKSPMMRHSESDASAPKQEVDCASTIEGKINRYAVNNLDVESDPFANDCEPVSGDEVDDKLDEIFSSKKQDFLLKTVPGPSTTMSRRAKKQKQKETQARLQQQREDERLRKNSEIEKQGGEQPVKSTKRGQRKIDIVRQKTINTVIKSYDQLQQVVQPPVYDDRRLYNEKSFDGDVPIPVKTIPKDTEENLGDFKINYHFLMRNPQDSSAFVYGKTLIKKVSDIEKKQVTVSKTQDKRQKRFLSKANFAYDLKGNKIPLNKNQENMDQQKKHESDGVPALQQDISSNSKELSAEAQEEKLQKQIAERKAKIEAQRAQYKLSQCEKTSTSSQIEEFKGSYDPHDGFKVVDQQIETKMESIKKEEEASKSSVCEESKTLAAIAALTAQVAELSKVISEQSKELTLLRNELAEKDREIKALKEKPNEVLEPHSSDAETKQEIVESKPEQVEKPTTSKATLAKDKAKAEKARVPSEKKIQRAKTMPVSKFVDDGVNKLVNMNKAETPAQKMEVIKNNLTLPKSVQQKAVNQEMRPVNAEKVSDKSFAEKLAAGLIRSKSSIRYSPRAEKKPAVPRPKGIQEKVWLNILKQTPETLENWEAKRKVKIFEQYKKLFYAQHVKLELLWQAAAVKAGVPKAKNDWLIAPGKVVALLRKEKLENVLSAIQIWRDKAATYIPKDGKIAQGWAKAPLPNDQ